MKPAVVCTNCGRPYIHEAVPYRCPTCGGIFDFTGFPPFNPSQVDQKLPGIWRYRHTFFEAADLPIVTLGEGNTPLVWAEAFDRQVSFKLEYLNPTGSFKDRGTAPMVSYLAAQGVSSAVEDSSGNAGSSFAAYAACAGLSARVFVPDYASGPKRVQIQAYGAELVRILGLRSNASQAVRRAADQGAVYASHVFLPFGLAGFATVAYELVEQLGTVPGVILMPVGQGSLLLGMSRGFEALQVAGVTEEMPRFIGVQALACAPLWAVSTAGAAGLRWVTEGDTLAEGIRIKHPERGDAVLKAVESGGGRFIVVEEQDILPGRDQLARRGLFVEPTSAVVWPALAQVVERAPDPIVVILTGSGFKQPG
jgi:threonine synthase